MLKRTRSDVRVHIQDVREMDIVVIVYNIIGNIKNCQVVSFQLMLRKHMTGLLKTS
ncbi:MAG: hypothetical protein IH631_00085 [Candidatus Thorarchaeota archaeon]|nr:hypothetical protein [Candidatus Thorarchaeota archaeon]